MNATAAARIESARTIIAAYTPAQRAACLALVEATVAFLGTKATYRHGALMALLYTSSTKVKGTERYDGWTTTPSYSRAADILAALGGSWSAVDKMPLDRQVRGLRMIVGLLRESASVAA